MDRDISIDATYEGGVLRPDGPLSLPDHSRVRVTVHESGPAPTNDAAEARAAWKALGARGALRLNGWRPTRDEMHDRS